MDNIEQISTLQKLANDNFCIISKMLGEDIMGLVVSLSKSFPEKRLLELIKMNKGAFIRTEEELQLLQSLVSNHSKFKARDCSLYIENSFSINKVNFLTRFGSVLFLRNVILGSPYEMLKLLDSDSLIQNIEFNGCGFIEHNVDLSGKLFSFSPYLESINILTPDTEFFKSTFKDIHILDKTDSKKEIVLKLEFPLFESDEFIRKISPHIEGIQILKSDPAVVWYDQMTKLYVRNFAELQSRTSKTEKVEQITFKKFSLKATKSASQQFDCFQVILKDISIQPNLTLNSLLENLFKIFPNCKHLVIPEKVAMLDINRSNISSRKLDKITIMYSKHTPAAYRANLHYYLQYRICDVELIPMIEFDSFCFARYVIQEETLPLMRKFSSIYYQIENNSVGAVKANLMIELLKGIEEGSDKRIREQYNLLINTKTNEDKLDEFKGNIEEIKCLIGAEECGIKECEKASILVEIVEFALLFNDNSEEALNAISYSFEQLKNQVHNIKLILEQKFGIDFNDLQFASTNEYQLEYENMDSSEEEVEEFIIEENQDIMIETE